MTQFGTATYGTAKLLIQATDGSFRQASEVIVTHNGTTAYATEYGIVYTDIPLYNVDVDINTGNVRVLVSSTSANTTVYRTTYSATVA